jgi:hypothetical protein
MTVNPLEYQNVNGAHCKAMLVVSLTGMLQHSVLYRKCCRQYINIECHFYP